MRRTLVWGLLASLTAGVALAQPAVPSLSGPVIDQADMLSSGEEGRLAERIRGVFQSGGPQIQIWTFPSLEGDDIAGVGIRAADAWKIGREGKDDGAILLVAERERRTRIEVGRGLEGVIPDVVAGRILRDVLRPALRAGATYDGFLGVVAAIESYSRGEAPLPSDDERRRVIPGVPVPGGGGGFPGGLFFIGFLVLFIFLQFVSRVLGFGRRRRGFRGDGVPPIIIGGWGGGGFGGGSRGGGGWSGGGGGFSGGGASGDW